MIHDRIRHMRTLLEKSGSFDNMGCKAGLVTRVVQTHDNVSKATQ